MSSRDTRPRSSKDVAELHNAVSGIREALPVVSHEECHRIETPSRTTSFTSSTSKIGNEHTEQVARAFTLDVCNPTMFSCLRDQSPTLLCKVRTLVGCCRGRRDRVVAAGQASVVRILLTPSATHWPLTVHQCQSWALSKVVRHTFPTSPTLRYDTSSGQSSTFVWTISLRDLDLSCLVPLSRPEKIRFMIGTGRWSVDVVAIARFPSREISGRP